MHIYIHTYTHKGPDLRMVTMWQCTGTPPPQRASITKANLNLRQISNTKKQLKGLGRCRESRHLVSNTFGSTGQGAQPTSLISTRSPVNHHRQPTDTILLGRAQATSKSRAHTSSAEWAS